MDTTNVEIVVIGGGVMGSSIAYHLARQGRRVLVVEQEAESAVEPTASWASAGGVRRQGRHAAEAKLASEAIARWHTLEQELDADLRYRHDGQLLLAESDEEAEYLTRFVEQQHELGFTDVRLVDRQEAHEIAPGLNDRVVAGSYSPADGQADPMLTTRAFASAARHLGAEYWYESVAFTIDVNNGRCEVETAQGEVQAEHVVLAAGAWSDEIAASLDLLLPIRTRALQMVRTTPAPLDTLRPVLSAVGRKLSLKQLVDGAFLIGGGWLGELMPNRRSYKLDKEQVQGNMQDARELFPAVAEQRVARGWCGLEAFSIDGIPFIGAVPNLDRLILACGFSGHGFALAPAVGRAVADLLAGQPVPELDGLSPARIATFDPTQVEAFIADKK
jgi:sarcosine oxidase, subunit beta